MNRQQIDHHRQQLEALLMRVKGDASAVAETALGPSGGQITGELSDAPTHLGDRGSEEYMTEMNALLLENEQHIVTESRAALERIQAGTYGRCENCGQELGRQRLDALPYTQFCVQCAGQTDHTPQVNLNSGRPTRPPRR
jgi:RNA polymerase-binding transcription factor DksA